MIFKTLLEHIDTVVGAITIFSTIILTLLGFGEESTKYKKLKTTLLSYAIQLILIFIMAQNVIPFLFILNISLFISGGLIQSTIADQDLEKELSSIAFLVFNSISWFMSVKNYWFFFDSIFISIAFPVFFGSRFSSEVTIILITLSSIVVFLFHYSKILKDFFGANSFNYVLENLNKNEPYALNMEKQTQRKINPTNKTKKLLAFIVFCEDKNYFMRKSSTLGWVDIKGRWDRFRERETGKNKEIWPKSVFRLFLKLVWIPNWNGPLKKYCRGYSTIEQQLIRQFSMAPFSYRYGVRRKLLIEWMYTPLFCQAVCNRKARTFGKKNKSAAKQSLRQNLKYMLLLQYYSRVLDEPLNYRGLIKSMAQQSRVSEKEYQSIYNQFSGSSLEKEYIEQINTTASLEYNFY